MEDEVNDGYAAQVPTMDAFPEFIGFPKVRRFFRSMIITEKIDGTNGQVYITEDGNMFIGSRNRWLTLSEDNHNFARWCVENKDELMKLGPGRHFGEWWGSGINRGYGLKNGEKRFSLFNVSRWRERSPNGVVWDNGQEIVPDCCSVVPILYRGPFDTEEVRNILGILERNGSWAAPGFGQPEGVMVYHEAGRVLFKATIVNDEFHKGEEKA